MREGESTYINQKLPWRKKKKQNKIYSLISFLLNYEQKIIYNFPLNKILFTYMEDYNFNIIYNTHNNNNPPISTKVQSRRRRKLFNFSRKEKKKW